jgi:hypothetical protein
MAILSVSRRTDIPTFYSEWFIRRLEKGSLMVRNPYNVNQVSVIPLSPETIDCIVFWTKNPMPMLSKLDRIKYPFYTQFTLTGYGRDMEENLPDKDKLCEAFQELSRRTDGHVIWRYDPIVFTPEYTPEWHLQQFTRLASKLRGYTKKCVISFVDVYNCNRDAMSVAKEYKLSYADLERFCEKIVRAARANGMEIATCAELVDLDKLGIKHNKCIDPDYIEEIIGVPIKNVKDGSQRETCGCVESIEVGTYNTCYNGCKYCYACKDRGEMNANRHRYDVDSPMLCDSLKGFENITERKIKSMKDYKALEYRDQLTLF